MSIPGPKTIISIDLSTECTGYAISDYDTDDLLEYGAIKPKYPKSKKGYPGAQLDRMRQMAKEVLEVILRTKNVQTIVIEEVNRGISRLGQKTLNGMHYVLLHLMDDDTLAKVIYIDSDGKKGWRKKLGLVLSEEDKLKNKEAKKLNKKMPRGQKLTIVNKKHLACRFINEKFGFNMDVDENPTHNDIVDAIGLLTAYTLFFKK